MKTFRFQVQFMTPSGKDGFKIVHAPTEQDAINLLQRCHNDWIILDAFKL